MTGCASFEPQLQSFAGYRPNDPTWSVDRLRLGNEKLALSDRLGVKMGLDFHR
jgi:hypothetical protein